MTSLTGFMIGILASTSAFAAAERTVNLVCAKDGSSIGYQFTRYANIGKYHRFSAVVLDSDGTVVEVIRRNLRAEQTNGISNPRQIITSYRFEDVDGKIKLVTFYRNKGTQTTEVTVNQTKLTCLEI